MTAERLTMQALRARPSEWHRRGMHSPDELDALVNERLLASHAGLPAEPTYADFLGDEVA